MAMIKTMNGEKSNFQIKAISMKPNCKHQVMRVDLPKVLNRNRTIKSNNTELSFVLQMPQSTYNNTDGDGDCIYLRKTDS